MGKFVLYEDENDNYNYEKGIYSTITFSWNDAKKTLTIADRKGTFPGMIDNRTFNLVLVGNGNGIGDKLSSQVNKTINYSGKKMSISL